MPIFYPLFPLPFSVLSSFTCHLFIVLCVVVVGMQRIRNALEETDKATSTPDIGTTNEATEKEGTNMTSKRDTTGSHKAVAVKPTPLPKNTSSSEEPGEKYNPDPDAIPLANEDFVLLDCQTSYPTGSLDSLIGALRQQIRSSDWLEENTPELYGRAGTRAARCVQRSAGQSQEVEEERSEGRGDQKERR